jgi:hypothetical protein
MPFLYEIKLIKLRYRLLLLKLEKKTVEVRSIWHYIDHGVAAKKSDRMRGSYASLRGPAKERDTCATREIYYCSSLSSSEYNRDAQNR